MRCVGIRDVMKRTPGGKDDLHVLLRTPKQPHLGIIIRPHVRNVHPEVLGRPGTADPTDTRLRALDRANVREERFEPGRGDEGLVVVEIEFLEPERLEVGRADRDGFVRDFPVIGGERRVNLNDKVDVQPILIPLHRLMPPQQTHRFPQIHEICGTGPVEPVKEVNDDAGHGAVSAAAEEDGADETCFGVEGAIDGGDAESLRVACGIRVDDVPTQVRQSYQGR